MGKIAIHGFGRIGRSLLKAALRDNLFVPYSISDIKDLEVLAALFQADSNYGLWHEEVRTTKDAFLIGGREIKYFDSSKAVPNWDELGVELVVDCTGRATTRAGAQPHFDAGAKRVLVSAPSKTLDDTDAVLLPGINMEQYDPEKHRLISMASCTTNGLAPVVKVLLENISTPAFSPRCTPTRTPSRSPTSRCATGATPGPPRRTSSPPPRGRPRPSCSSGPTCR